MAYAKTIDGKVAVSGTQVFIDWVEVTEIPESKDYRDLWVLVGSVIKVDAKLKKEAVAVKSAADAKASRNKTLDGLVHDFGDGRIMQTRTSDESNIRNAIEVMRRESIESMEWVMIDNIKYPITSDELQTGLEAGQLAAMSVWDSYSPK